ncbi:hypothetical protein BDZ89DRAFT_1214525 [Hymenopellis radicata]|nr:hypothetical protein BDZ89DRAFT_1214525 [Hymenopellis radicata]
MAAIFPDKRTRSQLTLARQPTRQSTLGPLALEGRAHSHAGGAPRSTTPDAACSHDEPSKKRAASPSLRANEGRDIEGDYENTAANPLKSTSDASLATEAPYTSSSPDKHHRAQPVPVIRRLDLRDYVPKRQRFLFEYKLLPSFQEPAVGPPRLPVEGTPVSDSKKSVKAGASKKKPAIPRVSRGALQKKEQQAAKAGQAPRSTMARKALISAAQASPKKAEELSPLSDSEESGDAPVASTSTLRVPQTPAKLPSFAKPTQSSLAKTPAALRSPVKASFESPTKLPGFTTLATRPTKTYAFQPDAKLQRSVAHETGKRIYAGNIKPIFAHRAACKASEKTPLAAVPGSPVKGDTSVVDLCEEVSYQGENRERLLLLRARTKDDDLKAILDNTLYRREAPPEEEEPMMRVSTAEAFDNLRQAVDQLHLRGGDCAHIALWRRIGPRSDDEDVDDGDLIDDKNYHGASKKKGGLTVLSHVRAFVDVRDSHTSRDSGEAFVEFLELLGAKVCKKLTKTCTHIVFKDGSFNTVATWKAAEAKPLVCASLGLGMCQQEAYVVEDEQPLDISDLFPSGVDPKIKVAKRHSFDESWELSMDSSLKPLEIARQRG